MEPTSPWKRPNEVMQLHRLKKRKKALQERMKQPSSPSTANSVVSNKEEDFDINFSRILDGDKRKNPFSKNNLQQNKKQKTDDLNFTLDESNDKTLFALLHLPSKPVQKPDKHVETDKLSTFSNLLQKYTAEHNVEAQLPQQTKHKHLPIDWSIKTKVRLMSPRPFAWNQKLKASEEASGITGFVRCLDTTKSSTLDTSPRARFHQSCLYWQHPHLPWLPLYPRSTGKVAATNFLANNEEVKQALHKEWTESFRSLFQLVRARHCPYFYVCANSLTVLFLSAGLSGGELCAMVAPSTRGLRHTLRQEDVEFTMPLRPDGKKKMNTSDSKDEEKPRNTSTDSCYDTMDEVKSPNLGKGEDDEHSGDEDPEHFLTQLGIETDVIKRINNTQVRILNHVESAVDSAAESLLLVRGPDAQSLFNFLLNCKSVVSPSGPYAGIPPTLLAPTAFHGGTLQSLKVKESLVYSENSKYYSVEATGPVLPSVAVSLLGVAADSAAASYSATFALHAHSGTSAFTAAAKAIALEESSKVNESSNFANAFNKENLSDCGISEQMLKVFCSNDPDNIQQLDNVTYDKDERTYSW